jgi:hypothetical protein
MDLLVLLLAGIVAPFFWIAFWAVLLWLTRRLAPRWEPYIWGPGYNLGYLIGRKLGSRRRAVRRPAS